MTYVGQQPATTFDSGIQDRFTSLTTNTVTLSHEISAEEDILVVWNNIVQDKNTYSVGGTGNKTVTLGGTLVSADVVTVYYLNKVMQSVNPTAGSVTSTTITDDIISGQTALGATPADTDEFLVSDAGTLKRVDYSHLKSGGLVLVHSSNSSSSATSVSFDSIFTTTYDNYLISGTLERGDTAGTYMRLLKSSDGSERSSDYYMTDFSTNTDDSTPDYSNSNGVSTFYIGRGSGSEAGADTWFKLWIKDPMGAANTYMEGTLFGYHDSRDNYSSHNLMGHNTVSEQHRGFKLVANSDNITAYNIKVWGLINS